MAVSPTLNLSISQIFSPDLYPFVAGFEGAHFAPSPVVTVMSNAQFRAEPAQPQQHVDLSPFESAQAQRQREFSAMLQQASREYYSKVGGQEIDNAIALLNAFAIDGAQYARKILRDHSDEIDARAAQRQQAVQPEAAKLPEGSEARKLVKQAARTRPIIDAAAATRLSKLLIELVNLRRSVIKTALESVSDMFVYVSDGKAFDSTLTVNELARRLKTALEVG
ncbi:MAG: hypothetical protein KBG84_02945 [Planctomycetes bacterium]|nr:hypothetical protein [Planctomycetota bacterium]